MPSTFMLKIIGAGVAVFVLLGLFLGLRHYKSLAESRGEKLALICQTTRDASGQPKLKCGEVPKQIQFMGQGIRDRDAAIKRQNAAVNKLAATSASQQAEAARASQNAQARARGAEATAERLRASARSTVPASQAVCKPSKELERAWR